MRVRDEISPLHPALAGHFPGDPIVPGVVLLRRVCQAVSEAWGEAVTSVPVVKFHAVLRPGEPFDIALERGVGGCCAFRVTRGETLIASGQLRGASRDEAGSS
jgi:3-hydroxymyristoyl/3-hydroxydecanoyl-(acyl carrier protein) dehydratase